MMPREKLIPIEYVRSVLSYDEDTGELSWKPRGIEHFPDERAQKSWNSNYAGKLAGTKAKEGYIKILIHKKQHRAHRLVFAIVEGRWPDKFIDHKNGIKQDNRFKNLRECDQAHNTRNGPLRTTSTSGLKGAHWDKSKNKWTAEIKKDYKGIFLGRFDTAEEAHRAYCDAATVLHGEFANFGHAMETA